MSVTATVAACARHLRLATTALRCFASVEVSTNGLAGADHSVGRPRRGMADDHGGVTPGR